VPRSLCLTSSWIPSASCGDCRKGMHTFVLGWNVHAGHTDVLITMCAYGAAVSALTAILLS
jgi:hypothetical protein